MSSSPPTAYLCPLTHDLMTDPVMDTEGNSYERSAIEAWLERNSTSPITRNPLTTGMLAPNRALQTLIEEWMMAHSSGVEESTIDETAAVDEPRCTLIHVGEGNLILETDQTTPLPTDLCLVIDVSGSMCARTTTSTTEREETNLSVLDVVRHAAKALVVSMNENDRLAVVTFASKASTILGPTPMDTEGKAAALAALDTMAPNSATNLWGGIQKGLCVLGALQSDPTYRNAALFVLTDGAPNVHPPRGEAAMVGARSLMVPVHTFGFGYSLDSQLLVEIAEAGNGTYSFIPDAGMVGTVFVHAFANLKATVFHSVKANGHVIGDVRLGAKRHAAIPIMPRLHLEASIGSRQISFESSFPPIGPSDGTSPDFHTARVAFYSLLGHISRSLGEVSPRVAAFRASLEPQPEVYGPILADLHDQVKEALSRSDWYVKWGRHYLPSLAMAHRDERCNNFKDPGLAFYAESAQSGPLWLSLRDAADEAYLTLPPPSGSLSAPTRGTYARRSVPSMATYHNCGGVCITGDSDVRVGLGSGVQPIHATRENGDQDQFCHENYGIRPAYHRDEISAGGCGYMKASAIKVGTKVHTPRGLFSVAKVVRTQCTNGMAEIIDLSDDLTLQITLWHPIMSKDTGKWTFPCQRAPGSRKMVKADYVYSFVLEAGGFALDCGDFWVATLGSLDSVVRRTDPQLDSDSVFFHPFFSTTKVLEALEAFPADEDGVVTLPPNPCLCDPKTNLIVGFSQSQD
jgi:Mg-chelatase subunit ChlD